MKKTLGILLALALVLSFSVMATTPVAAATPIYVDAVNGNDTWDGTSWATAKKYIQSGIDIVDPGGTVYVAAGTYQENLASWKDIEITKSLTLLGAGSGQTIVELTPGKMNGVEIRGSGLSVTIEGITFTRRSGETYASNFGLRIAETASTFVSLVLRDVEVAYAHASNVILGSPGTFSEVHVEDCHFHHAGTWGFVSGGTVNKISVMDSHFEDNGQVDPSHGNGFDLTGISSNVLVDGGSFSNNTAAGINLMRVSDAVFRNFVANDNAGAPGGGFGVKLDEWGGKSENIIFEKFTASGNSLDGVAITPEKDDAIENVLITGATLTGNGRNGLNLCYIYSGSNNPEMKDVTIEFSNIYQNGSHGVQVYSWWEYMLITEVFDATHNWWGHASGPTHSSNPGGTGDAVSDNVDFTPWLGAPMTDQPAGCTADRDTGATASPSTTNVSADATGGDTDTTVTVAEYVGNPTAVSPGFAAGAVFFDVHVGGTEPNTLVVEFNCPGGDCSGTVLRWFDGTAWQDVTPVSYTNGTVVATLSATSSPTIAQLTGTPFGLGGPLAPAALPAHIVGWETYPLNKPAVLAPWIALLAAIMAGVSLLLWRRRRAQI